MTAQQRRPPGRPQQPVHPPGLPATGRPVHRPWLGIATTAIINGPATEPLNAYEVKEAAGEI